MSKEKTETKAEKAKKQSTFTKQAAKYLKASAWLLEASLRTYVGIVILMVKTGDIPVGIALYFLGTAGAIVATHFAKAYKK